jgi:hypothetical protein
VSRDWRVLWTCTDHMGLAEMETAASAGATAGGTLDAGMPAAAEAADNGLLGPNLADGASFQIFGPIRPADFTIPNITRPPTIAILTTWALLRWKPVLAPGQLPAVRWNPDTSRT